MKRGMKQQGFSMIELMVAIVIVAIITAVALPSYQSSILRTNRNEARAVLYENQMFMEQRFAANNNYGAVQPALPFPQSPKGGVSKYTITLVNWTPTSYQLKATPVAGYNERDICGTFVIDNTARKTLEGTHSMSSDECWQGK